MYQLTWKQFAIFSLILPIFAAAIPVGEETGEFQKRYMHTDGRGTYYSPGLGSCGYTNNDNQLVVALSADIMNGQYCGKKVRITSNKKTVDSALIVDTCPSTSCGPNDLDMSPTLFEHFALLDKGVIEIDWDLLD